VFPTKKGDDDSERKRKRKLSRRPAGPEGEVKKSRSPRVFFRCTSAIWRSWSLRPEQEFETARHIEELELGLCGSS